MTRPRIYLESTIPSYLVARPSREAVLRGLQEATRRWWERAVANWYVSAFVELEISRGDPVAARKRMDVIDGLPRLAAGENVKKLAAGLLASGLIPAKAETDASHIAIAAVHGMDILLTWNCTHIHNAATIRRIEAICTQAGQVCPVICSPLELL